MQTDHPPTLFLIVLAGAMLLATLHLPYGYYQVLRLATLVLGAWSAWSAWNGGRRGLAGCWGLLALIYNPIGPIHFNRETWSMINVASGLFVAGATVLANMSTRRSG